jgi:hypothetical protein
MVKKTAQQNHLRRVEECSNEVTDNVFLTYQGVAEDACGLFLFAINFFLNEQPFFLYSFFLNAFL